MGDYCQAVIEQLWLIQGSDPVIWSMPVWATFEEPHIEIAKLHLAVSVLRPHMEAIKALLAPVSTFTEGMWTIDRMALERVGTQIDLAAGPDIDLLFTWERMKAHQTKTEAREARKDMDEFLDTLYQVGLPITREWLGILWNQICTHALDWLINKERPLDMYFVKLHNCPFRPDWKEFRKKEGKKSWAEPDLSLLLLSVENHKKTRRWIERWIEAEPTKVWRKNVSEAEERRYKTLHKNRYVKHVKASIIRFKECAIRLYMVWDKSSRRKHPSNAPSWEKCGFRMVPTNPGDTLLVRNNSPVSPATVVPGTSPGVEAPSVGGRVHRPYEALSILLAIQSATRDLRDGWLDLYRARNERKSDLGLPVLSPFEKRYPVQLLGEERRTRYGVAIGTKQLPRAAFERANAEK